MKTLRLPASRLNGFATLAREKGILLPVHFVRDLEASHTLSQIIISCRRCCQGH